MCPRTDPRAFVDRGGPRSAGIDPLNLDLPAIPPSVDGWVQVDAQGVVIAGGGFPASAGATIEDVWPGQGAEALQRAMASAMEDRLPLVTPEPCWVWQVLGDGPFLFLGRRADQTAREERFAVARRQLLAELAPAVAHDANNALGALLANLHYLGGPDRAGPRPQEQVAEAFVDSTTNVDDVVQVVGALRLLARGDSGRAGPLHELLRAAQVLLSYPLRRNLAVSLDEGADPTFRGHRGRLLHALLELLLAWGAAAFARAEVRRTRCPP